MEEPTLRDEDSDPLTDGLAFAFGSNPFGADPTASLYELAEGRYELLEEIGRGGGGVVHRAMDHELRREVAIKVLHDDHEGLDAIARRLVEEAQITAQLQHPGVVPVHGFGLLGPGRPFVVMKLVRGMTLRALQEESEDRDGQRLRFLEIAERLAQPLGYAHERGVVHRDLKADNVMVGDFGETQIMDWGLAKIVGRGGRPEGVHSSRQDMPATRSLSGSVMGTPSSMPPEQARGEVDAITPAADVFGLGALLVHLLTGAPPYSTRDREQALEDAANCRLDEAFARLDRCGVDAELRAIIHKALACDPAARHADAGALARALAAYREGVEGRARQAELAAAEARSRAETERKGRRRTLVLATCAVLAIAVAAGVTIDRNQRRGERRRQAEARLRTRIFDARQAFDRSRSEAKEAEALRERALTSLAAARGNLVEMEASESFRREITALEEAVRAARKDARDRAEKGARERALLKRLDQVRAHRSHRPNAETAADYAAIFGELGFSTEREVSPTAFLDHLRTSGIRESEALALGNWFACAFANDDRDALRALFRVLPEALDHPAWKRLWEGPEAWRKAIDEVVEAPASFPFPVAYHAAVDLKRQGRQEEALALFSDLQRRFPRDFWSHFEGADAAMRCEPPRLATASSCYSAACALRPDNPSAWNNLASVLDQLEDHERALYCYREALRREPDSILILKNLGSHHARRQDFDEAAKAYARILELSNDPAVTMEIQRFRASCCRSLNRHEEAVGHYEAILAVDPDAEIRLYLGHSLLLLRREDEAIVHYEERLKRHPRCAIAAQTLGVLFLRRGELERSLHALRLAFEQAPEDRRIRESLAGTLVELRRFREADRVLGPSDDSASPIGLLNRFALHVGLRRLDAAEALLPRLSRVGDLGHLVTRATYFRYRDRLQDAEAILERARSLHEGRGQRMLAGARSNLAMAREGARLLTRGTSPANAEEWRALACRQDDLGSFGAAAKAWTHGLADDGARVWHRMQAVRSALQAAATLDAGEERSALEKKAATWFESALRRQDTELEGGRITAIRHRRQLLTWKHEELFESVRGPEAPAPWRGLWASLQRTLDRSR